ncbi:hypothetical protein FOZ62_012709, partial [Perkinsus olseni]
MSTEGEDDHKKMSSLCPRFSGEGDVSTDVNAGIELFLKKRTISLSERDRFAAKAAGILKSALKGRAAVVAYSLPQAKQDDFDLLVTELRLAFGLDSLTAWAAFCSRKLGEMEPIDGYVANLRVLLDISHPRLGQDAKSAVLRSQFVWGLPQGTAKGLVLAKYEDAAVPLESLVVLAKDHFKAARFEGAKGAGFAAAAMRVRAEQSEGLNVGKGKKGAPRFT